jgi:hypothetical protein
METRVSRTLRRILAQAATRPIGELLSELDELEEEQLNSRDRRRNEHLIFIGQTRLRVSLLCGRPVRACLPFASAVLTSGGPALGILSLIGSFAIHCEERGAKKVGARYLEQAIAYAEREQVGLGNALPVYNGIVRRLG